MPGNPPTGLLPTSLARGTPHAAGQSDPGAPGSPGTQVDTAPGRDAPAHLSLVPGRPRESVPASARRSISR